MSPESIGRGIAVAGVAGLAEVAIEQMTADQAESAGDDERNFHPALREKLPGKNKRAGRGKRQKQPFLAMDTESPAETSNRQTDGGDAEQAFNSFANPDDDA